MINAFKLNLLLEVNRKQQSTSISIYQYSPVYYYIKYTIAQLESAKKWNEMKLSSEFILNKIAH